MNKKNTVLIVIIAVLVIIAGTLIANNRYLSSLRSEAADFTVYDTASITKLFFADKSGHQTLLQRTDDGWMVNNEYKAAQRQVNDMLYTLNRLRIRMPVSVTRSENILKRMSGTNTKVEVYQMLPSINLFNKVKLFYHEKRSKVFYIGDVTQDNQGTYVLKEGADRLYVVHLNGFRGFISARFSANPIDWRDHLILSEQMNNIESVQLEFNEDPDNSFIIKENGRYQFEMNRLNGQPVAFDTLRVLNFMSSFKDLRFEAFLYDVDSAKRDSIIHSPFQERLTLTTKEGTKYQISTFRMRSYADNFEFNEEDENNPDFHDVLTDPDHKYAYITESDEFVLIQDFVFGKLLKKADFYRNDHFEPVHQIYYKELETVESK